MAFRASIVVLLLTLVGGCGRGAPEYQAVSADDGLVRFSRTAVDDGGVHFYTFSVDGRRVNFFIRSDGQGRLHTHLDACYSCFKYGRGFVVEDQDMVCVACRLRYSLEDEFWDYIGACAPIPIHSSVDEDEVTVEERMLRQAAGYF